MNIAITSEAGNLVVRPKGFLGTQFDLYRDVCTGAGARYMPNLKVRIVGLIGMPKLVADLKTAGFEVAIHSNVAGALRARAGDHRIRLNEAEATVASLEGLSLWEFQKEGVAWLRSRKRGILGDHMGLGKTIQALIAVPNGVGVLVICPAGLKLNWRNEARRWRPDLRISVLSGRGSFRFPVPGEIVILNYDILPGLDEIQLDKVPQNVCLIADELHYVKNRLVAVDRRTGKKKAPRGAKFELLAKFVREQNGWTWGLTGTPLINRWEELYSLLMQMDLHKETFGTKKACEGLFLYHRERVPLVLRAAMLRRTREEVLPDLPTKIYSRYDVESLGQDATREADEMMKKLEALGALRDDGSIDDESNWRSDPEAAAQMIKARKTLAAAKIPEMDRIVEQYEEAEEKLLVWSAHRAPVDHVGKRPGWATITGDVTGEARQSVVDRFQRGELKGLGITIAAGGVGITLTAAHVALFVDLSWTPAGNAQAEDRQCRIGQTRGVQIIRMVADHPLDRRVFELLDYKQSLISTSVDKAEVKAGNAMSFELNEMTQLEALATMIESSHYAPQEERTVMKTLSPSYNPRRQAVTREEIWAAKAIVHLDDDHAREINGQGFNKLDGEFGHEMASLVRSGVDLSEKQWAVICKIARRYPRQVGRAVEEVGA